MPWEDLHEQILSEFSEHTEAAERELALEVAFQRGSEIEHVGRLIRPPGRPRTADPDRVRQRKAEQQRSYVMKWREQARREPLPGAAREILRRQSLLRRMARMENKAEEEKIVTSPAPAARHRLEDTREGVTLHFTITTALPPREDGTPAGVTEVDGYLITGVYPDGKLGELFVHVAKQHEAFGPMLDQWAIGASMALQHGVDIDAFFTKFVGARFEPSGSVRGVPGIDKCTSPVDLISRFLKTRYSKAIQTEEEASRG